MAHQHPAARTWPVQEQQGLGVRRGDGTWEWKEGDPLAGEVAKELLDLNAQLAESPVRGAAAGGAHAVRGGWEHAGPRVGHSLRDLALLYPFKFSSSGACTAAGSEAPA